MNARNWVPSWTNPGSYKITQQPSGGNAVFNNLYVKNKLIIGLSWIQYTPTISGYDQTYGNAFAAGHPATGMVYTSVGRYLKFGNLVSFDLSVNITNRGNCISDLNIDLPPFPSNYNISAVGTTQATGNTNWSKYSSLTGWAAPNATQLRVYSSGRGQSDGTGLCQLYTTGAFDIYISG
jgi:hypothetical protein